MSQDSKLTKNEEQIIHATLPALSSGSSEIGYDEPENFRDTLTQQLTEARALADQHGMLYTVKYLAAAALAAEIEAGEAYYLREADEELERQGARGPRDR